MKREKKEIIQDLIVIAFSIVAGVYLSWVFWGVI